MKKIVLVILIITIFTTSGFAYFMTCNKYLEMSDEQRICYIMGVDDCMTLTTSIDNKDYYQKWKAATEGMTAGQLRKIVDKYLDEHPEILHMEAAYGVIAAIQEIMAKRERQ